MKSRSASNTPDPGTNRHVTGWLSTSLPSIGGKSWPKCGQHTSYVSKMNVEEDLKVVVQLHKNGSEREMVHHASQHRLTPGVDHWFQANSKRHVKAPESPQSTASEDDHSEDDIGTEQHRYKSPAPKPMKSQLARDISVDLMRMRRKSQYSPRKTSFFAASRPSTSMTSATAATAIKSKASEEWEIVEQTGSRSHSRSDSRTETREGFGIESRADGASTSCSIVSFATEIPVSQETEVTLEEAPEAANGPVVRTSQKILKEALQNWRTAHADHLEGKQRIITQYLGCCAFLKRSPFLINQLRSFLLTPSSDYMHLSGLGITSKDIAALTSAMAGKGCGLKPGKVTSIQWVCGAMGEVALCGLDLSNNALGADGALTLVNILLQADMFRLAAPVADPNGGFFHSALTDLNLARNAVGTSGAKAVEGLLRTSGCTVARLDLSSNMLGDAGAARVVKGIWANTSLTWLALADNSASHVAGTALGGMLERNQTLVGLDLNYNHLRGAGARRVGYGLGKNRRVEVLRVQWNGFGDEDVMTEMAQSLRTCSVTELNLAHNRLRLKGAAILAASVEMGSRLKDLVLDGNLIGQIGARVVFRAFQRALALGQEFATTVSMEGCGTHLVDRAAFDPCETAGPYTLDLADAYSRSIITNLIRVNSSGAGSFVPIKSKGKATAFNGSLGGMHVCISDNGSIDPSDWSICTASGVNLPISEEKDENGEPIPLQRTWARLLNRKEQDVATTITFSFNNDRKRAAAEDCLSQRNMDLLAAAFGEGGLSAEKCIELIETIFGSDVFVTMEQMEFLLDKLSSQSDVSRVAALGGVRVVFVARCFHKLVESDRNMELLDKVASLEERKALEKALGAASFDFCPNNPTGYHKLDLADASQREICLRLVEIKNGMADREAQLDEFYNSGRRAGGRRENWSDAAELERVWRNSRLDGKGFRFGTTWRVPYSGILEIDFCQITKPDPNDARSSGDFSMQELTFRGLISSLQNKETPSRERISVLRRYSNSELFTCPQLGAILLLFEEPELRAEVCVIGYARTLDWHGFKNVILRLSLREVKILHQRIGVINLWDDVMAVDYYELDLSRNSERFIMQELLHIAAVEPGDNMVDGTYQGIDFTVPSGWLKEVPRTGVISFYYCREQQVIERVFEKGAWDGNPSPFHQREDDTEYGPTSWSTFAPRWLLKYCERNPKVGPSPCIQPHDTVWVRPYKVRRIKMKMMDKFQEARDMFNSLDKDGGGSLSRKELAMGLFSLGIWLAPTELQALLAILDKDGGGEIDFEEFEDYWNNYNFD